MPSPAKHEKPEPETAVVPQEKVEDQLATARKAVRYIATEDDLAGKWPAAATAVLSSIESAKRKLDNAKRSFARDAKQSQPVINGVADDIVKNWPTTGFASATDRESMRDAKVKEIVDRERKRLVIGVGKKYAALIEKEAVSVQTKLAPEMARGLSAYKYRASKGLASGLTAEELARLPALKAELGMAPLKADPKTSPLIATVQGISERVDELAAALGDWDSGEADLKVDLVLLALAATSIVSELERPMRGWAPGMGNVIPTLPLFRETQSLKSKLEEIKRHAAPNLFSVAAAISERVIPSLFAAVCGLSMADYWSKKQRLIGFDEWAYNKTCLERWVLATTPAYVPHEPELLSLFKKDA